MKKNYFLFYFLLSFFFYPEASYAHPGHETGLDFSQGCLHVLSAIDHIAINMFIGFVIASIYFKNTMFRATQMLLLFGTNFAITAYHYFVNSKYLLPLNFIIGIFIANLFFQLGTFFLLTYFYRHYRHN